MFQCESKQVWQDEQEDKRDERCERWETKTLTAPVKDNHDGQPSGVQ